MRKEERYNDALVCFLDILGFKEMSKTQNHDELMDIYKTVFEHASDIVNKVSSKTLKKDNGYINTVIISDSVIVYATKSNQVSLLLLILTVQSLMFLSFSNGLPLRGGISKGNLSIVRKRNNIILLGDSIVKAYELEASQNWSGCAIDPEIIQRFLPPSDEISDNISHITLKDYPQLLEYQVPLQKNASKSLYAINWTNLIQPDGHGGLHGPYITQDVFDHAFSAFGKDVSKESTQLKIKNTQEFLNFAMDFGDCTIETSELSYKEIFKNLAMQNSSSFFRLRIWLRNKLIK